MAEILRWFDAIGLPDSWVVAGCIAQTVRNLACGRMAESGIKDIDVVYFDAEDLSAATEAGHDKRLVDYFSDLPVKLDVKNQARVHLWYKFECCAPFGLEDLFALRVRPNKRQITRAIYAAKVGRWRSAWPELTFMAWDDAD